MSITEFLLARIGEDEKLAHDAIEDDGGSDEGFSGQYDALTKPPSGIGYAQGGFGAAAARMIATYAVPTRVLAECAAKRAIIKQHEQWPVLVEKRPEFIEAGSDPQSMTYRVTQEMVWLTEREYVKRFGDAPPTAPMIRTLAAIYADHPDYDPTWSHNGG